VLISGTTPSWTNTPTLTGTNFSGIPNSALVSDNITIGSTSILLGATSATLAGLTSINNVAITTPGSLSTLTIASGKTLTANNTIILEGTDGSALSIAGNFITSGAFSTTLTATGTTTLTLPTTGTLATTSNINSALPSATTSQLYGGSGSAGAAQVVTVGSGLALSGGTLTSTGGTLTSLSVATANGFAGTVATPTTTPVITLETTINGVIKGNGTAISLAVAGTDYSAGTSGLSTGIVKSTTGTGALTIALSGTDYAPATSGSSILYGNSAGGFSNVTVGSGLSFTSGTLISTGTTTSWSALTAPVTSNSVTATVDTSQALLGHFDTSASSSQSLFTLGEDVASTKTGATNVRPIILELNTLSTSTAHPFQINVQGQAALFKVSNTGNLSYTGLPDSITAAGGSTISLTSGLGGATNSSGAVSISTGNATGGSVGSITLQGGNDSSSGAAGNIYIIPGTSGSGTNGSVLINVAATPTITTIGYAGNTTTNINGTLNLGGYPISLAGALTTSGAYSTTLTTTGATTLTLPTSGTLATLGANTFNGLQTISNAQFAQTFTNSSLTSGVTESLLSTTTFSPGSPSAQIQVGITGIVNYTGTSTGTDTGHQVGILGWMQMNASGQTYPLVVGIEGKIDNVAGTISTVNALNGQISTNNGSISTYVGCNIDTPNNAGTINDYYGSLIQASGNNGIINTFIPYGYIAPTGSGSVGTTIGFSIPDTTSTILDVGIYSLLNSGSTKYFIYAPGTAQSYFGGSADFANGLIANTFTLNGSSLSLGGNFTTSGAYSTTLTATGATTLTLPTSGTLATTANINTALPAAVISQLYGGSGSAGTAQVVTVGSGLSLSGGTLISTGTTTSWSALTAPVTSNSVTASVDTSQKLLGHFDVTAANHASVFEVGEDAASTSGSVKKCSIFNVATVAGSTAYPFNVTSLGQLNTFYIDGTGGLNYSGVPDSITTTGGSSISLQSGNGGASYSAGSISIITGSATGGRCRKYICYRRIRLRSTVLVEIL